MFDKITKAACLAPTFFAIYLSCRGFVSKSFETEIVVMLTLFFAALTWLLSVSLNRYLAIRDCNKPMAYTLLIAGFGLLIIDAAITHVGVEWVLKDQNAHPLFGWIVSIVLSVGNITLKWVFLGHVEETPETPAKAVTPRNIPTLEGQDAKVFDFIGQKVKTANAN